jgi:uroporphyrinogen-III synthase
MKVKTILVSQPPPKTETSPYFDLSDKQKVKIYFRSFIHVEGISVKKLETIKLILKTLPPLF